MKTLGRSVQESSVPSYLRRNDTSFPAKVTPKLRALYEDYKAALADPGNPGHKWASILKYYQYLSRAVMTNPEYGIGSDGNARGLLFFHQMGLGKTRLAVAIAMAMWDVRPVVVLLARGLQKNFQGTLEAVTRLLHPGASADELSKLLAAARAHVTYVSQDAYNAADQLARAGGLDGRLLIIDEAHNLFRAIINSSAENANARRIYDMVMTAYNLRIVALTGTPAAKNPFELVPCFNMLAGRDLLPTQYETFCTLYVDRERRAVRNRAALANRLVGLVSHVSTALPTEPAGPGSAPPQPRDDGWLPAELPTVLEKVPMGHNQYRFYLLAREKELAEGRGGAGFGREAPGRGGKSVLASAPLSLPGSAKKAMSSYYVKSRMLSTFCPPREWMSRPVEEMPDEVFVPENGPKLHLIAERCLAAKGPVLVYSQFVEQALKPLGRYLRRLGFEEFVPETGSKIGGSVDAIAAIRADMQGRPSEDVPTSSLTWALASARWAESSSSPEEVLADPQAHPELMKRIREADLTDPLLVLGAQDLEYSGEVFAEDLHRLARAVLERHENVRVQKVPAEILAKTAFYGGATTSVPLRFAIISGEVSTEAREVIKDAEISLANLRGGVIKAVLVSKAGAEGLDMKYLVETHTVESYWDKAREDQVKFRAIRMGSHDALPCEERQVQPYLYLATANREIYDQMPPRNREESTIDEMFHTRALDQYEINSDFRKLLAETCLECSLNGYGNCRVCVPTGAPLFHDDPSLDARLPDPCETCGETDVQALPIEVRGNTYFYSVDPVSPLGYAFYEYRAELGAYSPIDPSDSIVADIMRELTKNE